MRIPTGILKGSLRKLAIDGTRLKIGARFQFYPGTSQMTMEYENVASVAEKESEFLSGKPFPMKIEWSWQGRTPGRTSRLYAAFYLCRRELS